MGTSYLLATPSTTMKMHLGLLVVLACLAMGQKGRRCPTNIACDLRGGACFPGVCRRGYVQIGSCTRTCVCCRPVEGIQAKLEFGNVSGGLSAGGLSAGGLFPGGLIPVLGKGSGAGTMFT